MAQQVVALLALDPETPVCVLKLCRQGEGGSEIALRPNDPPTTGLSRKRLLKEFTMRLRLLTASAAVVIGLALTACNGVSGSPAGSPASASAAMSGGAQVVITHNGHKYVVRPAAGVKILASPQCAYSKYSFCFYVYPGDTGPYLTTSDGTTPLYNVASIVKAKNNKVSKKFKTWFSPDPGDPTSQYIKYKGKAPKTAQPVKYTDVYCIGYSQDACANNTDDAVLYFGIAVAPAT